MKTHASIYCERHSYEQEVSCSAPVPLLRSEKVDFEGRPVNTSKFVMDNPKDRFKGLRAVDFSLENQQSVGFEGKPTFYEPSRFNIENHIEKLVQNENSIS